ncbi:hypothetical protein FACS1894102_0130 [Spirochaetia bacterium]|nr:hypothetical protein FACS1894102_0130 [Spirochaetia bacterium]
MSAELIDVLKQVVSSPEVLGITLVLIIFWNIVSSVANPKPKIKVDKAAKIKRPKAIKEEVPKNVDTEDLGIE